ncbi:MAG: prepilin peptidase [Rubripirellula sp.]
MPRWRSPIRIPLILAVLAVISAAIAYIFGVSALQAMGSPHYDAADLYIPRLIDVVIVAWCFWVGSAVGSFLNVVAWRMPRGESINGRSHCPRCEAQLKARDNFPVFGWIALGGRCRTCRLPISARYPIVEALVGLTITVVAICELYRLCLPYQPMHWHGGPFWAPVVTAPLLITLLYHVVALATTWAIGLIRIDGIRLPKQLLVFAAAAIALPMIALPMLMIVPWQLLDPGTGGISKDGIQGWVTQQLNGSQYFPALARVITSVVAATFFARVLAKGLCPTADPKLDPLGKSTARLMDLIVILAVPITIVGWQVSPALIILASLIAYALQAWLPAKCDALGRFAIAMPLALTIQIVFWRAPMPFLFLPLENRGSWFWPTEISRPWVILGWSAMTLLVPWWLSESKQASLPQEVQAADPTVAGDEDFDDEDALEKKSEDLTR